MTAETDDEDVVTGVRRIASVEQWKAVVERLRGYAREIRGFEMLTNDEKIDALAEGIESIRDIAVREVARRTGKEVSP